MSNGVSLHALDTGSLTCPRKYCYGWGGDELVTVPCPGFLIRHPKGDVVFEGGFQTQVAGDVRSYYDGLLDFTFNFTPEQHVRERVKLSDVDPDGIEHVIMSHLHMDHAGAIGHFPNATYRVHGSELAYARNPDWFASLGYQKGDLDRPIEWVTVDSTEHSPELDLFGDGTVRTLYSPGHAKGVMSMLLELEGIGPVVLPSDAAYSIEHYENREFAGSYLDGPAYVRSIERLKRYQHDLGTDLLVFTHDPVQWPKLPKNVALTRADLEAARP
jgi:N-acyl homoserine lactone hydrolase